MPDQYKESTNSPENPQTIEEFKKTSERQKIADETRESVSAIVENDSMIICIEFSKNQCLDWRILSDEIRIKIISLLMKDSKSKEEIANQTYISPATISRLFRRNGLTTEDVRQLGNESLFDCKTS